jgi:AraC-like DNA-binding protein
MSFHAIPFDWMRPHTTAAVRQGWSLDALLASSMIELRHGDRRDVIGPEQAVLLCINTVLAAEDAAHGMARTGLPAKYPAIGVTMALGCANLETAIEQLCRLYGLASSAIQLRLQAEAEEAVLSVHTEARHEVDAVYLEEVFLLWLFMQILHFLGQPPRIVEVTVRDPFHFNLGRAHWAMRGPVRHGEVTSLRFPRALLARSPAPRAGASIMWECQKSFLVRLNGSPSEEASVDPVGIPGLRFADMVRESGKSANTLRRRLQASEGGFRLVRQRALVDAATARLRDTDESVEEVAAELGYSDARSFRRFLKRATGLTPGQVRERRGSGGSEDTSRVWREIRSAIEKMNL